MPSDNVACLADYIAHFEPTSKQIVPCIQHCKVIQAKPPRNVVHVINGDALRHPDLCLDFLKYEFTIDYDALALSKLNPGTEFTKHDVADAAAIELSSVIVDTFVMAALAYPTRLYVHRGYIFYGETPIHPVEPVKGITREVYVKHPWPQAKVLSLSQIAAWGVMQQLVLHGVPNNPLERALSRVHPLNETIAG